MTESHIRVPKPSSLLALVCLAVAARLRSDWIAVKLTDAAAQSGVSPQRLSRLCSRAIAPLEATVAALSRVGRPPADRAAQHAAAQRDRMAALLGVATSLLSRCPLRGAWVRSLVVGAWLRLKADHPKLTRKSFCEALALSERTLRHWLRTDQPPSGPMQAPAPKAKRDSKRPPRRGRFSFAVTVPDTQVAADTTDLRAFGQDLKLIAAQDIGGRDMDLLDDVLVDDHESAELVIEVLTAALQDMPGQQAVTDQGTPYMAQATRDALEQLGADHAPQREADPLGKATIERAFGTIKRLARPLLSLTDRIADAVQALRNVELAKAVTTVLLTALLRAYQAGARAAHRADVQRAGLDEQTLMRVAQQSRQQAHAEDTSARLLLSHIHHAYQIGTPVKAFIRAFRRFPLPVLRRAERAFASQAHRDDIRQRQSYFAALVRRFDDDYRTEQTLKQRHQQTLQQLDRQAENHAAQIQRWADHPQEHLDAALTALASQWQPATGSLLLDGAGLGRAWLKDALATLVRTHDLPTTRDIAAGTFDAFSRRHHDQLGPAGSAAIEAVLHQHLDHLPPTAGATAHCANRLAAAILNTTGPPPRPDPSPPLRT